MKSSSLILTAALGICELDILQEILLTKQAKALVAQDVQIPFRHVAPILEEIAFRLPSTCAPRSWFIRVFVGPTAKVQYHHDQDSAHYQYFFSQT